MPAQRTAAQKNAAALRAVGLRAFFAAKIPADFNPGIKVGQKSIRVWKPLRLLFTRENRLLMMARTNPRD